MVTSELVIDKNSHLKDECHKLNTKIQQDEMSSETDSISLTTDEDDREVIRLQYDDDYDDDEYYVPGVDDDTVEDIGDGMKPGYKRMDLTGESESDKDLIIYSLNESLQIHKQIVERIQNEKDEIEQAHEDEIRKKDEKLELERQQVEQEQSKSQEKMSRLESIYQALVKEVEAKKLDYRRMENRFHSHVKDVRPKDDGLGTIKSQIEGVFQGIHKLCSPLGASATATTLDCFYELWPEMMDHCFENQEIDASTISLLTEKMLADRLVQEVFETAIHPGVSLNSAFGKIYQWVEKRNVSWAARMRQQISAFVVKQSNEETEAIENVRDTIIQTIAEKLCWMYRITVEEEKKSIKKKWAKIVDLAFKLNFSLKCQDNPLVEMVHIQDGSLFNESLMSYFGQGGDTVAFVVSPPFIANQVAAEEGFLVPAKVYCI